jgi:hypothetical protein
MSHSLQVLSKGLGVPQLIDRKSRRHQHRVMQFGHLPLFLGIFFALASTAFAASEPCSEVYEKTCAGMNTPNRENDFFIQLYRDRRVRELQENAAKNPAVFSMSSLLTKFPRLRKLKTCDGKTISPKCGTNLNRFIAAAFAVSQAAKDNDLKETLANEFFSGDKALAEEIEPKHTARSRKEINDQVQLAKNLLIRTISKLPLRVGEADKIKAFLGSVELEEDLDSPCHSSIAYEFNTVTGLNPVNHKITICGKTADRSVPIETLFLVLSHEVGHSISVCSTGYNYNDENWPKTKAFGHLPDNYEYQKIDANASLSSVRACLRTEKSVRARPGIDLLNDPRSKVPDDKYTYSTLCGSGLGMTGKRDAIEEAIADWLSAEAFAEYVSSIPEEKARSAVNRGILGLAKIFCNISDKFVVDDRLNDPERDPHPINKRRIERVFMTQPKLKSLLSCNFDIGSDYCDGSQKVYPQPNFQVDRYIPTQFADSRSNAVTQKPTANSSSTAESAK